MATNQDFILKSGLQINGPTLSTGTITAPTFIGALIGNASTATALATPRTIAYTGDAIGSGTFDGSSNVSFALTLAASGVVAGTYTKLTVDSKGRVTTGALLSSADITSGLGFTPYNATNPSAYISANQNITVSGDATGSGSTAIALTLANTGVVPGTYTKLTVDAKGRATLGASLVASDVTTALGFTPINSATLGANNGVATLDGSGKLSLAQIPASLLGAVVYQGTWNASTNTPAFASGVGTKGYYYKVSVAGSTAIDGISQWNIGDTIIFDGSTWDKIDGIASEVTSVFGRVGAISLLSSDVTGALGFTPYNATNPAGYISANQSITYSGDVTGTGTTSVALTLANTGVVTGTYNTVTVDSKGRVTTGSNAAYLLANQNISISGDAAGSGTTAISLTLANTGVVAGTYNNVTVDSKGRATAGSNVAYLTTNQAITFTGDASGSGSTSVALTLAASGVTAGTYSKVTVDVKGRVVSGSAISSADVTGALGFTPLNSINPVVTGPLLIGSMAIISTNTTFTSGAIQTVDSFATAAYRAAKYVATVIDSVNSKYHVVEFLLLHDGTNVYKTEYAQVTSVASLGTFDATITTGTLNVTFLPAASSTYTVRIAKTEMAV
jgi:phage-related tail fiber protein